MKFSKNFILSDLLACDQNLKWNILASLKSYLLKIILTFTLNKIESNKNKFLNNFDCNAQVKAVLVSYLFLGVLPQIVYKQAIKKTGYAFSFKTCLTNPKSVHYFMLLLTVENSVPLPILPTPKFSIGRTAISTVNFAVRGALFVSLDYLFTNVFGDWLITNFIFNTTLVFNLPKEGVKRTDFAAQNYFYFWQQVTLTLVK
jgi:hypothetical protein